MRAQKEISAGGIVVKREGAQLLVLLTQHSGHKGWIFPKGHLEAGETAHEAAVREVAEETGIKARVVCNVGRIRYAFHADGRLVLKSVVMYLMEYVTGEVTDTSSEVSAVKWVPAEEVARTLTYPSERALWAKAQHLLARRQSRSA
jgi:mutator protein MutT